MENYKREFIEENISILDVLVKIKFEPSKSEARCLIVSDGISVDSEKKLLMLI